jgi:hypothetical protein
LRKFRTILDAVAKTGIAFILSMSMRYNKNLISILNKTIDRAARNACQRRRVVGSV